MTTVNVNEDKYSITVTEGATTVITVKAPGPQGPGFPDGNLGDVTSSNTGASVVVNSGAITNAKVNDSAAIAGTKISPDFGSQNITTTGNAVFGGDLTVSGTTTTIDTTTLRVEDKNIELGKVGSPTDITADGGGITLLGDTNHTFNWLNATDSWTSSEHIALPDNKKLQLGDSQDLQLFHDSNNSVIDSNTGDFYILSAGAFIFQTNNNENAIKCVANGGVELYHDNVKKCETSADGLDFPDNSKLQLGDSQDALIYHSGSQLNIDNNTGNIFYDTPGSHYFRVGGGNETAITAAANGSVELYYDNVKKLETQPWGVNLTGTLNTNSVTAQGYLITSGDFLPNADNSNDLGSSTKRFSTLHSVALNTGDINMSNLNNNGNDVDGSKGSWSLQEGADDLFIINRVSGKKYKFNLIEIG